MLSSQWKDLMLLQECCEALGSNCDLTQFELDSDGLPLDTLNLKIQQILRPQNVTLTKDKIVNLNLDNILKGNIFKDVWILLRGRLKYKCQTCFNFAFYFSLQ